MAGRGKRGPRPLPKGEALSRVLTCRVRPAEEKLVREAARVLGQPTAKWIRATLVRAAKAVVRGHKHDRGGEAPGGPDAEAGPRP